MVREAPTKINRVGPRHTIYLQKDLVEDSTFPFQLNESLNVRVDGEKLIIERGTGKKSFVSGDFTNFDTSGSQQTLDMLSKMGYSPVLSRAEKITEMLKEIHENETLELRVRHIPSREHAIVLWRDRTFLDRVLSEFFDNNAINGAPRGLFSERPNKMDSVDNTLYSEFVPRTDEKEKMFTSKRNVPQAIANKILELDTANRSRYATRVAIEDLSWFIDNGLEEDLFKFEEIVGTRPNGNITVLCGYNIANLNQEMITKIIGSHSYVIMSEPLKVYRRPLEIPVRK